MTLRIIHTGDLHIGQRLLHVCRLEEHRAMLGWIASEVRETKASVLLIAGDVFDRADPSAAAQRLFFDWLAELQSIESLRQVVITAGNHDSAAQLQAFNRLFSHLEIHVVGADSNRNKTWLDEWVIPLKGTTGAYEAVVAAVPFLLEFRFGLRNNKMITSDIAAEEAFKGGLKQLYSDLADQAEALYPGLPLVAMGHLTAVGEDAMVGPQPIEIHRVLRNSLDGTLFDRRYSYVALGHIHKNYRVFGPSNAWYCGSPLACSIDEAEDERSRGMWLVELESTHAYDLAKAPQPLLLKAPLFRKMLRIKGTKERLYEQLSELSGSEAFRTLVWIEAELPIYELNLLPELRAYVRNKNIRIVSYRSTPISAVTGTMDGTGEGTGEEIEVGIENRTEEGAEDRNAPLELADLGLAELFINFLQASEEEDPDNELLKRLVEIASDAGNDAHLWERGGELGKSEPLREESS